MTDDWKVVDADARILMRTYSFGGGLANTFVCGLGPGELMVISPACKLAEADFAALESHGKVVAIVSSNSFHYLGVPSWSERWPNARCFAAEGGIPRLKKKCPSISFEPLSALTPLLPEHVVVVEPPRVKLGELMARVKTARGWVWFINDLVANTPTLPENIVFRKLFQWTRSGPGFSINRLVWMLVAKDKTGLRDWLIEQATQFPPAVLVVGHGHLLEGDDLPARLEEQLRAAY